MYIYIISTSIVTRTFVRIHYNNISLLFLSFPPLPYPSPIPSIRSIHPRQEKEMYKNKNAFFFLTTSKSTSHRSYPRLPGKSPGQNAHDNKRMPGTNRTHVSPPQHQNL